MSMNPVAAARERLGLSRTELALALGVDYVTVSAAERGLPRRLPRSILDGLAQLGFEPAKLADEYLLWRAEQAQKMRA